MESTIKENTDRVHKFKLQILFNFQNKSQIYITIYKIFLYYSGLNKTTIRHSIKRNLIVITIANLIRFNFQDKCASPIITICKILLYYATLDKMKHSKY